MASRTTEKELKLYAENASNCIESSGYHLGIGGSYGYTSVELYTKDNKMLRTLESGLTMGQARQWLSAFIQGCHYAKETDPKWKWEKK
jgi:hypothetical protein